MSKFRSGRAAALTVLIIAALATTARAQSVVQVRLYDTGHATTAMRAAAIRTAAAILADAGIVIAWQDCTQESRRPDCQKSRHADNLIVFEKNLIE